MADVLVDSAGQRLCTAVELRDRLHRGDVSAQEVMAATLARIERFNPQFNAVVSRADQALTQAEALDAGRAKGEEPGPLHGLPVIIKDVTETAGLRTTYGSPVHADHIPEVDALVVQRLKGAGAIVIGKGNTPEVALGGHTTNDVFGDTLNPWNPELSPGGSTGGGGVALVTGMASLCEGTDLGGSLRIPAAYCGLVGIRPSPGLVPTWPTPHRWDTLQVTGPMARSAEDLALFLSVCSGFDPRAPLSWTPADRDYLGGLQNASISGRRYAYCADPTAIGIHPELEKVCRSAAFELRDLGVEVEEVEMDLVWARDTFRELRGHWALSWHQHRLGDEQREREPMGKNLAANLQLGLDTSSHTLAAAGQKRARILDQMLELFQRFDGFLTPTMAVKPFRSADGQPQKVAGQSMQTYIDWLAPTSVLGMASLPVTSVPAGLDSDGLPVGLQMVAPPRDELGALVLARAVGRLRPVAWPGAVK